MKGRAGWRLLATLAALNVLSYVDRQLVAALAPLLMADLGLSRAQIGFLLGVAFIVVFSIATIAMALLADRWSRTRLVAVGLGVWSAATALTGAATGLGRLAAARALVGVGEATLSPSALAILADAFPPARLGLANGVFYAGIPLGFACSFALAAWLAPWLGWRSCFLVLGAAGLVALAFVWRMADPPRGASLREVDGPAATAVRDLVPRLRRALADEPTLALVALGAAALAFTSAASQHGITWLVQERNFAYARAAWLSALVTATAGLGGNLGIGALTDRARRAGAAQRIQALVAVGCAALGVSAAFYLAPAGTPLFYACWLGTQAWMLGWYGPVLAAVQELAPPRLRATAIGFVLLTVNLLGVALGPWVTGLIGDRASLTQGLLVSLGVGAAGLLLLALAAARLERARAGGSITP